LDPRTGEVISCNRPTSSDDAAQIDIPVGRALIVIATEDASQLPGKGVNTSVAMLDISDVEITSAVRMSDNILAIDFCSLEMDGHRFPEENVLSANLRYWKAHGFDTNGWSNMIQYRDQILARDKDMLPGSGGVIRYVVDIADGVDLSTLKLAIECPELWQVTVNDAPVTFAMEQTFRDPRIHWTPVAAVAWHGCNEIKLVGRPFNVRQEIDQIYILGDFSCEPVEAGFRVIPSRMLSRGSWKTQGLPFYDAEVSYRIEIPTGTVALSLPRDKWGGALVIAYQNGVEIGRCYESPWILPLSQLTSTEIELRVVGFPKNLFGPWHDPTQRWGFCGPFNWEGNHIPTAPQPGASYRQCDSGIYRV
jgi:hypothetical protein